MRAAYERASYNDAARIFDYFAGSAAPFDTVLLRARIFLKQDEHASVIRLLTERKGSGHSEIAQRAVLLAAANGQMGKFAAADEFFDEAESLARAKRDRELQSEIAYHRARRYLVEGKIENARAMLAVAQKARAPILRLRARYLESSIFACEGRYRKQADVLLDLLRKMELQSGDAIEIRARATQTLGALAREMHVPGALAAVDAQLAGTPWPEDFAVQRFRALEAVGWCHALIGDYFNAFRYLKRSGEQAVGEPWRTVAACDRAYLARCNGEPLWSQQELAEAEDYASQIDWPATRDEERLGLLLLAELFVPVDTSKAAFYLAQYDELNESKSRRLHLRDDARPVAFANYSRGLVHLAIGKRRLGIESLRKSLETFAKCGYDWRAGRSALRLFEAMRDESYLETAKEKLRHYMGSWLGKELRVLSDQRHAKLPPMQRRVFEAMCRGLSSKAIAKELGRSEFTVRNHIKLVFKTFGVNSRSQLLAEAARQNII